MWKLDWRSKSGGKYITGRLFHWCRWETLGLGPGGSCEDGVQCGHGPDGPHKQQRQGVLVVWRGPGKKRAGPRRLPRLPAWVDHVFSRKWKFQGNSNAASVQHWRGRFCSLKPQKWGLLWVLESVFWEKERETERAEVVWRTGRRWAELTRAGSVCWDTAVRRIGTL